MGESYSEPSLYVSLSEEFPVGTHFQITIVGFSGLPPLFTGDWSFTDCLGGLKLQSGVCTRGGGDGGYDISHCLLWVRHWAEHIQMN